MVKASGYPYLFEPSNGLARNTYCISSSVVNISLSFLCAVEDKEALLYLEDEVSGLLTRQQRSLLRVLVTKELRRSWYSSKLLSSWSQLGARYAEAHTQPEPCRSSSALGFFPVSLCYKSLWYVKYILKKSFQISLSRPFMMMDPWVITPDERARHTQQFQSVMPENG